MAKKFFCGILSLLVLTVCCISIPIVGNDFGENPLENIANETNKVPAYVAFGVLNTSWGKIPVEEICEEQSENIEFEEIFCIKDQEIYFVFTEYVDKKECWAIASVKFPTLEFEIQKKLLNPMEDYCRMDFAKDYKEKNGYYYAGKIILTDHENVLEYDLSTKESHTYFFEEYSFPQQKIYGESSDGQTLEVIGGDVFQTFTLSEMAEKSKGISALYSLRDKKTLSGTTSLERFFQGNCLQVVEEEAYVLGRYLTFPGESYLVILQYNKEKSLWQYVMSVFVSDLFDAQCYIVPQV